MKRKLFWWVLAIGLLVLAMLAMKVVEGRSQDLVPRAYLPLVMKKYEVDGLPPRPTLTPTSAPTRPPWPTATPVPTTCGLGVKYDSDYSYKLYYMVAGTGIGWKLYEGTCSQCGHYPYGEFAPNVYTWYAESQDCGQASGTAQFLDGRAFHAFDCIDGMLIGVLSQYPH